MKGLIFTYLLTYGGSVASLFNPFVGFLIYVCFGILKPDALWFWAVGRGNYSRIVAVGLLMGWLLHGLGNWKSGRARPILISFLVFWGWLFVTAMTARFPDMGLRMLELLSKTIFPFLVGLTLIDSVAKLKQLAWVIALSQGYLAFEFNLTYLGGRFDSNSFLHGTSDNNGVALSMVTGLGIAFFLGLNAPRKSQKVVGFACAALMAHFILFSMSRGAMVGMMFTGVVTFVVIPKTRANCTLLAFAAAGVLYFTGPLVIERLHTVTVTSETRDKSAQGRLTYWIGCARAAADNPLLGVGPGCWQSVTPQYDIQLGRAAHSTWMQISAEMGLPGVISLLLFYGLCCTGLWSIAREKTPAPDPALHDLARMALVSITGFMVCAQFLTLYGLDLPYIVNLLGAGVLKMTPADAPAYDPVVRDEPSYYPYPLPAR